MILNNYAAKKRRILFEKKILSDKNNLTEKKTVYQKTKQKKTKFSFPRDGVGEYATFRC